MKKLAQKHNQAVQAMPGWKKNLNMYCKNV
jgi:hypothetical protein